MPDATRRNVSALLLAAGQSLVLGPLVLVGVALYAFIDRTAGLVLIGACLVLVALAAAQPFIWSSARLGAALSGISSGLAIGLAVLLARTGRRTAWLECLAVAALAVIYLVRGWRRLKA